METAGRTQEILHGTVAAVLFQNQENGYTVVRFTTEEQVTITVVGTIPLCKPGEHLVITGHWESHVTHGPQFRAEFLERVMPTGAQAIEPSGITAGMSSSRKASARSIS